LGILIPDDRQAKARIRIFIFTSYVSQFTQLGKQKA
jgi:hypothetical protein